MVGVWFSYCFDNNLGGTFALVTTVDSVREQKIRPDSIKYKLKLMTHIKGKCVPPKQSIFCMRITYVLLVNSISSEGGFSFQLV